MGLGSTAKKVQIVAERAEQMVEQIVELRERIIALEGTMEDTSERVKRLEHQNETQQALLEALAEEQGIDVDEVLTQAAIKEAEVDQTEDEDTDDEPLIEDAEGDADNEPEDEADDGASETADADEE